MRGTVAKRIRREVYGEDGSYRHREYSARFGLRAWFQKMPTQTAGRQRAEYQHAKREVRG